MKILILDSSYLIYKSYFAFRNSQLSVDIGDKKIITSAIFGFMKEIIKMKSSLGYDFIISTWDSPPYKKKLAHPSYKENRSKNKIPNMADEIEIIQALLHDLRIPRLFSQGYEAEEVMKGAKKKLKEHELNLFTTDEDCFALLSSNTSLITTRNSQIIETTKRDLFRKYGVKPRQFHAFKTLTGCTSDNVKGAKGIGPKRASYILAKSRAKTLDKVLQNLDIYPETIKTSLKQSKELLETSSFLTKIETPKVLFNKKRPEEKIGFLTLLDFIEAKTLTSGRNKLILKKLKKSQKRLFKQMKETINWKNERSKK